MGTLQTNPPTVPNTVSDSWQVLVERDAIGSAGKNKITLTNWDETTTIPQLAQGSIIDIDGSLAVFAVDEAIGGTPVDGKVYLKFVVSGSTVTPEFTAETPTWYADKAGWYNAAGERFSGHNCSKAGTAYTYKYKWRDESEGDSIKVQSSNRASIDLLEITNVVFKNSPRFVTRQFTSAETYPLPEGTYMFCVAYPISVYSPTVEMLVNGVWVSLGGTTAANNSYYIFAKEGLYRMRAGTFSSASVTGWIEFD